MQEDMDMENRPHEQRITLYADRFAALGNDARLRIMRLLLSAHPDGMVVGDIQAGLGIPSSTLSHHLDKLKNEHLVEVERRGTFLRYRANTAGLQEILSFLYAECCTRNRIVNPDCLDVSPGDVPCGCRKGH